MALLLWDGFDSYGSMSELNAYRSGIENEAGIYLYTSGGRFNGCRVGTVFSILPGNRWGKFRFPNNTPISEVYTGRAIYLTTNNAFFAVQGNATSPSDTFWKDVYAEVTGGVIKVWNFAGTLLGTSATPLTYNKWNWVEMRVKMSSTTSTADGIVQFWLNNQLVISNTACITKAASGSTGYDAVNLTCYYNTYNENYIDDIYVADTTGSAPWNTRLGDVRIATVVPNADVGPNQGTQSTGATHYGVVDETIPNTSDWIGIPATSANSGEMFAHIALPTSNGVEGILATAVIVYGRKTDAGNANFKISLQTNGARYNSNSFALTTSNVYYRQDWVTNPNTGIQWANSDWHSANIGFYVV